MGSQRAPEGCPASWRAWVGNGLGLAGRSRRSSRQFKAEIVELCQRGDRTIGQVAKDFDLTETAVREWVKQAELDAGDRSDGLTSDEPSWRSCAGRIGGCVRTW
ncbi:transposase [Micromonospora sp. 4G55]|uniref:transposase n=1 Tax=Micromonospora sp. 4G55 TaxID=2806102 RepID=UPI0035C78419